jgi:glycerol kinase
MQIQADLLGVQIFRPDMVELTALGAAKLAARGAGLPRGDRTGDTTRMRIFNPSIAPAAREEMLARWRVAVGRA